MKLKYKINTIIKYNKEFEKYNNYENEVVILGNKCICICNFKNCFIFNQIFRLIQTIELSRHYITEKNIILISNYPNLFALIEDLKVNIYEVQLNNKKGKVILKRRIDTPKKYINRRLYIFSLSSADILYFFQDNFFIYNIKTQAFTYKKFFITVEKKYESLKKYKQIIKIIEYNKNDFIILLRDIIFGKEDDAYNCTINIINSVVLYDIENSELKKVYITTEDSGESNTYLNNYYFYDTTFSENKNIFIINKSIVYIKDFSKDYQHEKGYSLYIINILNGDIKYKFEDNSIQATCRSFYTLFPSYKKSIYLCDNIFLFNGYELEIKKNGVKDKKIDLIYGINEDDYNNNQHFYIKLKKNLFLLYNSQEIKICHFSKL